MKTQHPGQKWYSALTSFDDLSMSTVHKEFNIEDTR
jgi:hypothetical protein